MRSNKVLDRAYAHIPREPAPDWQGRDLQSVADTIDCQIALAKVALGIAWFAVWAELGYYLTSWLA